MEAAVEIEKLRTPPSLDELACIIRTETGCGYGEGDKAAAALILRYWPANSTREPMRPDPDERDYPERLRRVDVDSALRPLMLASAAEIERLQGAKRAALAIADERSKENVALRAALKTIEADSIASTEPNYVAVPALTLASALRAAEQKVGEK